MIECEDPEPNVKHDARVREMYLVVMKKFLQVDNISSSVFLFFLMKHFIVAICCGLGLS